MPDRPPTPASYRIEALRYARRLKDRLQSVVHHLDRQGPEYAADRAAYDAFYGSATNRHADWDAYEAARLAAMGRRELTGDDYRRFADDLAAAARDTSTMAAWCRAVASELDDREA